MAGLSCGIVGLPNVGKSTLFNVLTSSSQAEASNYPFCTIDPNVGVVPVIDPRLDTLSTISASKKIVYATMQFVDIAGLVAGASTGEGLGNKFLANIRETDAIVQVVRCFESSDIVHVAGKIDPIEDIQIIALELCLADLQMIENAVGRYEKQARGKKELQPFLECLIRIRDHLNQNKPVRLLDFTAEEREFLKAYPLLTAKKTLYVANISENDLPAMDNALVQRVREYASQEGNAVIAICAKLEEEIAQLPLEERKEYLDSLGLTQSGLQRLIQASFKMVGAITFLTTGEMESRAWTIMAGSTAAEAAGKIHTDIQKGFIRAEVTAYDDFVKGCKMRLEGKEYIVQDGDVILFRHQ